MQEEGGQQRATRPKQTGRTTQSSRAEGSETLGCHSEESDGNSVDSIKCVIVDSTNGDDD